MTLAQAGGTVVLSDNYLRVRVAEDRPENVRVHITGAGEAMSGLLVAPAA